MSHRVKGMPWGGLGGLALLAACGPAGAVDWPAGPPAWMRQTGVITDDRLPESSGAARGRASPGVIWTLNDSGNPPLVFGVDTSGTVVAVLALAGARNVDWEAILAGPCGADSCLYVGDVGDNGAARRHLMVYQIREPAVAPPTGRLPARVDTVALLDSLRIELEGGPRDVEAMVMAPDGDLALISKGRREWPLVFRVSRSGWAAGAARARIADTLPIRTGLLRRQLITDAALSPDGTVLAVRSYRQVFLFRRRMASAWLPDQPAGACDIAGREPLGEGLTWWSDRLLLSTSERRLGRPAPIHLLQCDAP